ncbi:Putative E3 ubiquitin-protein ligase ARI8 [Picochlorum sp. SENEW3]|nr:Putative E3 ubiquitin-protein ligase ARI8 [Picochlorum sp. SENEW3]
MSGNVNVQLAMEQQESVEFEGYTSGGTVFEEASSCRISDSQDVEIDFTEINEEKIRWETLSSEDLYRKMLVLTGEVSSIVGARRDDLMGMLIAYKWDAERFQEEWFSEPERVRSRLGLGESVKDAETQCQICFDRFETETDMLGCGCGHSMCKECWKQYVHSKVEDGGSSLDIRCPVYKCGRRAPAALVEAALSSKDVARVKQLAIENFVEKHSDIVWCPGVDCGRAVRLFGGCGQPTDVSCAGCHTEFCFQCMEEGHRPVDCQVVKFWKAKNDKESLNMEWLVVNTKGCPGCNRPIQKNHGCMHMTCSQCKHEFCWLCLGDWKKHSSTTGGYYSCNMAPTENLGSSMEKISSQRLHLYFWERWAEHDKALKIVRESIKIWESEEIERFSKILQIPTPNLGFVTEAWKELERCQKFLKWAYVAGYFSFDDEVDTKYRFIKSNLDTESMVHVRRFFDFTQNDAEIALERLSHKLEVELSEFKGSVAGGIEKSRRISSWNDFRQDLIGLTDVTRNQFLKLVRVLEHGLDKSIQEIRDQSSKNPVPHTERTTAVLHPNKRCAGHGHGSEKPPESWTCLRCNLLNSPAARNCELCDLRKH